MQKITSPHDAFFRNAMTDLRVATDFFKAHLPAHVQHVIQFDTLTLRKETFIDEQLKITLADMLYSVNFDNKPGYLYLLVEHQSSPDYWLPFRVIKYITRIMDRHLNENQADYLPLVYPLIFYNGKVRYDYSTNIIDLFENQALAQAILFKPFQLVDIGQIPDEVIRQTLWSGVLELAMKHIFVRDSVEYLKNLVILLRQVDAEGGSDYIKATITYLVNAADLTDEQAFIDIIKQGLATPKWEKDIMTIAERLEAKGMKKGLEQGIEKGIEQGIEKGIEQGIEQGRLEAKREIIIKMLEQGISIAIISQITQFPVQEIEMLISHYSAQSS